jgi:hypothetical protein
LTIEHEPAALLLSPSNKLFARTAVWTMMRGESHSMVSLRHAQKIEFKYSAVHAAIKYLKDRSSENLGNLFSLPGSKLAYNHYRWSSIGHHLAAEDFWKRQLGKIHYTKKIEQSIAAVGSYLETRHQSEWLGEILRYLPHGHILHTAVYLIVGYDNIVFGEDTALNLNDTRFHKDCRESVYYLIHEVAHAGYLRYHRMPDLTRPNTWGKLSAIVKFLTHLEGMGVISSMRIRTRECGFLDHDYKSLRSEDERARRVRCYFRVLSRLENEPERSAKSKYDFKVYDELSAQPRRLWYITGSHMAQMIEAKLGTETLRELVKKGSTDFFKTYIATEDPLYTK